MASVYIDPALSDDARRERPYAGDVIILSATSDAGALVSLARAMLEEASASQDPRTVHNHRTPGEVAGVLSQPEPTLIHPPECKAIVSLIMAESGVDLHHPSEPDNAIAFYPRCVAEPVNNDGETYDCYEGSTNNRAAAVRHVKSDSREQQEPQRELTSRCLPPPGGVIAFSGAQLHKTVPNATDPARDSIDFGTVDHNGVVARRGAAKLASRCTGTPMRDSLRAFDLQKLPGEVIALYDNDTATADQVLRIGDRLAGRGQPRARSSDT